MRTSVRGAILLAALALTSLPTALAQGGQQVVFGPSPPPGLSIDTGLDGYLDVLPGATRTLVATLRNDGNETLALSLRAFELPQGNTSLLQLAVANASVTIEPGASARVEIEVSAVADAPTNATPWFAIFAERESARQMLDERVPVRIGPPCPECVPPAEPPMGGNMIMRPGPGAGGSGPAGDRVFNSQTPGQGGNGTRTVTPPAPEEDDPYRETPGPGALLAIAGALVAMTIRRRRAGATLALLAMLACAPATLAVGERTFALTAVSRDGDDALVTVSSNHGNPYDSILTLVDSTGRLLAPEQSRAYWSYREPVTFRFADINATDVELRIHYFREGNVEVEERLPLRLPAIPAARFELVSTSLADGEIALGIENAGDASSLNATARLEDAGGTRVGSPLTRDIPSLGPGARTEIRFGTTRTSGTLQLVLTHANATQRIPFEIPTPDNATRLELVSSRAFANGTAEFVLAHLGGAPLDDAVAHLETASGARVGAPTAQLVGDLVEGGIARVRFEIPGDDSLRLVLDHANGSRSFHVDLSDTSGEGSADVTLDTELPSREAQVGSTASYSLTLENLGGEALVELRAEGLPAGYDASFTVGGSTARSIVVPEDATRQVTLAVSIPQSASRDAGASFPFTVVASAAGAQARVALTLQVIGAAKLDLAGQNWFASASAGQTQRVTVQLRNTGSAEAQDVEMAVSAPTGWSIVFTPSTIDALPAGATRDVEIAITPPVDAGSGRYVVDVSAAGSDVTARARSLSVEIAAEEGSRLGWLVGASVAGLAATALIVKLRRR